MDMPAALLPCLGSWWPVRMTAGRLVEPTRVCLGSSVCSPVRYSVVLVDAIWKETMKGRKCGMQNGDRR
jgi:hypothetical protein